MFQHHHLGMHSRGTEVGGNIGPSCGRRESAQNVIFGNFESFRKLLALVNATA